MELKLGFSLHIVLAMIRVTTPEPTIHSLAWGPGLEKPSPVLPVRYFFLQAVDAAGRNITASSVDLPFQLTIIPLSGHCGIFKELLDRKDGTYIGRYRIYDQCQGLRLEVRLKDGQQITGSPWIYEDVVVHSNCDCPSQLEEWKEVKTSHINLINQSINQSAHLCYDESSFLTSNQAINRRSYLYILPFFSRWRLVLPVFLKSTAISKSSNIKFLWTSPSTSRIFLHSIIRSRRVFVTTWSRTTCCAGSALANTSVSPCLWTIFCYFCWEELCFPM